MPCQETAPAPPCSGFIPAAGRLLLRHQIPEHPSAGAAAQAGSRHRRPGGVLPWQTSRSYPPPPASSLLLLQGAEPWVLSASACPCLCLICLILGCFIGKPTKYQTYSYSARDAQRRPGETLPVPSCRQGGAWGVPLRPFPHPLAHPLAAAIKPLCLHHAPVSVGLGRGSQELPSPGGRRRFGMAAGSALSTCPSAHAWDDPRTKARGPRAHRWLRCPRARGYLWLPGVQRPLGALHGHRPSWGALPRERGAATRVRLSWVPGC